MFVFASITVMESLFALETKTRSEVASIPDGLLPPWLFSPTGRPVRMNVSTLAEAGVAGHIRVATQREGAAVLLTVADNGTGMDERTRGRAFDEFFTTKPQGKGCGIGLALSRRLLRESGGDIALESRPGKGALVSVRLPV